MEAGPNERRNMNSWLPCVPLLEFAHHAGGSAIGMLLLLLNPLSNMNKPNESTKMQMYKYVHVLVCIYIYLNVYIHIHIHIYIYIYICIHVYRKGSHPPPHEALAARSSGPPSSWLCFGSQRAGRRVA